MQDAQKLILQEKEMMMLKLRKANVESEKKNKNQEKYGLTDEGESIDMMRELLKTTLLKHKEEPGLAKIEEENDDEKKFQQLMNNKDKDFSFKR